MTQERNKQSILGVAIRDMARLREVAAIVVKHGFGELLERMPFAGQLFGNILRTSSEAKGTPAERFTHLLADLGPTYIKLGQVLSMRKDLLPPDYIRALSTLQDGAPEIPYKEIRATIEAGLGRPAEEIFAELDEAPLATASIGQTHRALTKEGRKVVVKVQRKGIDEVMRGDLDLLYLAARGLEASIDELKLISPSAIISEFEKSLLRELNFTSELANLLTMRRMLDPERSVTVPVPLPELSSRTVLTMEFFDGKPVRSLEPGSEEARHAMEEILHAMCRGVFIDGFFHGDPHGGNILVDDEGNICFLDLGLVGTLSPEQRDDLVTLVLGTIMNDASTVARVLLKMGTPTQRVDISDLKREITRVRTQYLLVSSVDDVDSEAFIEEFADAVRKYKVKLATEYSVLVKAAATIEGMIRQLYPSVDVLGITKPYVEQIFQERFSPQQMFQQALGGATGVASLARTVPNYIDQILHDFETGNVQVRPITPTLDTLPDRIYQSATRVAVALFAASMSISAAIVIPDGYEGYMDWARIALFVVCLSCAIGGWTVTWWWHFLGRGASFKVTPLLKLFRRG